MKNPLQVKKQILIGHLSIVLFMGILFVIYPLFIRDGYFGIGHIKYLFLRRALRIGCPMMIVGIGLQSIWYRLPKSAKSPLSLTDLFVLGYSACIVLSTLCSVDRDVAWTGDNAWYMGAELLLLLNLIYFIISRFWMGDQVTVPFMLGTAAIVFTLGILNRFSIWPIQIAGSFQQTFISTLGNIGWYNGYLSVIAPVGIGMLLLKKPWKKGEIWVYRCFTLIVFLTALSQGGDTIFLFFAVLFALAMVICSVYRDGILRWLELLIIWSLAGQMIHLMRRINETWYNYESDNLTNLFNNRFTTLWILIPAVVLYYFFYQLLKKSEQKAGPDATSSCASEEKWIFVVRRLMRLIPAALLGLVMIWLVAALIYTGSGMSMLQEDYDLGGISPIVFVDRILTLDAAWGSGRGTTIAAGWNCFAGATWWRKLIGVGPDCFSISVHGNGETAAMIAFYFGSDQILSNAHCEPITMLVNLGIVGTSCYYGIFVSYMKRSTLFWKKDMRILAILLSLFCYLGYNILNYAQILNYPFMILILAIGETWMKRAEMARGNAPEEKE